LAVWLETAVCLVKSGEKQRNNHRVRPDCGLGLAAFAPLGNQHQLGLREWGPELENRPLLTPRALGTWRALAGAAWDKSLGDRVNPRRRLSRNDPEAWWHDPGLGDREDSSSRRAGCVQEADKM